MYLHALTSFWNWSVLALRSNPSDMQLIAAYAIIQFKGREAFLPWGFSNASPWFHPTKMTSRCSSLMALRASCDLVLGLQVAHTSNELARIQSAKRGNETYQKSWEANDLLVWGGGVLEDGEVPVRIIASKLEVLGEKQTWKGTNQILQHSCFPSEFWVQRKTPVFEAKKGNLKRSIYIHSSVIVYTNWGVQ